MLRKYNLSVFDRLGMTKMIQQHILNIKCILKGYNGSWFNENWIMSKKNQTGQYMPAVMLYDKQKIFTSKNDAGCIDYRGLVDKTMTRISSCKILPVNWMWMWVFTAKMHIWIPVGLVCSLQSHIHTPAIQMACKPAQEIYSKHETKSLQKPQINTGAYKARDWAKYWRTTATQRHEKHRKPVCNYMSALCWRLWVSCQSVNHFLCCLGLSQGDGSRPRLTSVTDTHACTHTHSTYLQVAKKSKLCIMNTEKEWQLL